MIKSDSGRGIGFHIPGVIYGRFLVNHHPWYSRHNLYPLIRIIFFGSGCVFILNGYKNQALSTCPHYPIIPLVDVGENVPKEEEAFQKVEDDRVKADCNFRKVCD